MEATTNEPRMTDARKRWRRPLATASILLALSVVPQTAAASDGVLEIDQSCVSTGCFESDAPGWPITLAKAGSYRLTSPLDVYVPGGAIEILEDGTTVDLNGFAVRFCSNPPQGTACFLLGSDDGIDGSGAVDVTIRNGVIQGFLGWGIDLNMRAHVEDVALRNNSQGGLRVGSNSLVQDNRIAFNGGPGAQIALGSGWGGNVLVSNAPDWTGAPLELQRNVCSGSYCVWDGPRRFYLTPDTHSHAAKGGSCAAGFRVAHASELNGSAALYFDEGLSEEVFLSEYSGWVADDCKAAYWEANDGEGHTSLNVTEERWVVRDTQAIVAQCHLAQRTDSLGRGIAQTGLICQTDAQLKFTAFINIFGASRQLDAIAKASDIINLCCDGI